MTSSRRVDSGMQRSDQRKRCVFSEFYVFYVFSENDVRLSDADDVRRTEVGKCFSQIL